MKVADLYQLMGLVTVGVGLFMLFGAIGLIAIGVVTVGVGIVDELEPRADPKKIRLSWRPRRKAKEVAK